MRNFSLSQWLGSGIISLPRNVDFVFEDYIAHNSPPLAEVAGAIGSLALEEPLACFLV